MKRRVVVTGLGMLSPVGKGVKESWQNILRGKSGVVPVEGFDTSEDGTGRGTPIVPHGWAVRRLTPVECERLQGFPDGYTNVPWRGKDHSPDGRRYKALGNSMAANVMQWIGQRIELVRKLET